MCPTESSNSTVPTKTSPGGPLRGILNLFSTVWFGVFLAVLLFLYSSVGSAMPAVRQHPALELTEFEWFHWWPFNVLIGLLCVTMVTVTIRRIPFRFINAGVLSIHSGIILLCIGSYYYFGTKVEGDTPVFRRRVLIYLPGMDRPESLVALPGSRTAVQVAGERWGFQIQGTNTAWPILSDEHAGETAYAVSVLVTPPSGDPVIRQLLAGYPQYTEDVIPGKGRAIKSIGRKLVHEQLKLSLDYEPQDYFYVMKSWALYVRRTGEKEWVERPIRGLPRYHDRVGSRDLVHSDPNYRVPLRTLDLPVEPAPDGDVLDSASVRITGYLRYAHMQREWRDGGVRLNPVARLSVLSERGRPQTYELQAFDSKRKLSPDGMVEFRWLDGAEEVASLQADSTALLSVSAAGTDDKIDVPITAEALVGRGGPFTKIEGTPFSFRILSVQDDLVIPSSGSVVSVAMVEIETPEGRFTRMVADRPEMTRDMHGETADPHAPTTTSPARVDARITMTYRPRSAPIILAAHPTGMHLVVNGSSGRLFAGDVRLNEAVEVVPGLSIRVENMWPRAVSEVKPRIVPPESRQRNAGEAYSMIRLEVQTGRQTETKWLRFNQYAFANERYSYAGRFSYFPEHFHGSDGQGVEIMFSRERRKLRNPVALEEFSLDTHTGGCSGQALTIRNYVSSLRFRDNGQWTEPEDISVNAPTEHGGYWFFQSTWDKPSSENPTGGMNYTGLGVGNRNGVYIQLAGCCLAVAGMMFAFYVKPILKRRRYEQSPAKLTGNADPQPTEPVEKPAEQAVQV